MVHHTEEGGCKLIFRRHIVFFVIVCEKLCRTGNGLFMFSQQIKEFPHWLREGVHRAFHLSESGLDAVAVESAQISRKEKSAQPRLQLAPPNQGAPYLGYSALVVFLAMQKMNNIFYGRGILLSFLRSGITFVSILELFSKQKDNKNQKPNLLGWVWQYIV